jgi:GxxExxY protein
MNYIIEEIDDLNLNDLSSDYGDNELNALTYVIIGIAMEVYNNLGKGFSENVYKDCLCIEFVNKQISYIKEKKFDIIYKGIKIPHHYFADFIIDDKVVLEIKAHSLLIEDHTKQIINYLAVSRCKVGLIINFGENSLKYKRVILTK